MGSVHHEIQNLRENVASQKNIPRSTGASAEEVQKLSSSVASLKHFTNSCQEQIQNLQNQINHLRETAVSNQENENYLQQLERRVQDLRNLLNLQLEKASQPKPVQETKASPEYHAVREIYSSPISTRLSNIYQHKNPFSENLAGADSFKSNSSAINYTSPNTTANYLGSNNKPDHLSGVSSLRYPLEFAYSRNEYPKSDYISAIDRDSEPTGAYLGSNIHDPRETRQTQSISESKPYYGDPKVKALIDQLTKGKRVGLSVQDDPFDKSKISQLYIVLTCFLETFSASSNYLSNPATNYVSSYKDKEPLVSYKPNPDVVRAPLLQATQDPKHSDYIYSNPNPISNYTMNQTNQANQVKAD